LILGILKSRDALTMEEMKEMLPQLNWWELFQAVDGLSRSGAIILRRKGFDYELQAGMASPVQGADGKAFDSVR
jgi:hypothetical protein